MKVAVNLCSDATEGFSVHSYSLPTQILPFAWVPAVEEIVPHNWQLGGHKHAFTSSVYHKAQAIVQEGHDAGPLIADKAMGLNAWANGRRAMLEIASCRKIAFAASTVKMNGKPAAAANDDLPLMTCGEPAALPSCWPLLTTWNSVHVGLTVEDVQMGWVGVGISMYTDVLFYAVGLLTSMGGLDGPELVGGIVEAAGWDPKKAYVNAASAFLMGLRRSYTSGWTKPVSFKIEVGVANVSQSLEIGYDPVDHKLTVTTESGVGTTKASVGGSYDAEDGWDAIAKQNLVDADDT